MQESKTTVLFVSPDFDIGTPSSGEGVRLKELSQRLADRMDVRLLIPARFETDRIDWPSSVYTFRQWSYPFLTDLNPGFLLAMYRILRDVDIDILHLSKGVCSTRLLSGVTKANATVVYAAQNVEATHAGEFVDQTLPLYKRTLGPRIIPHIEQLTVGCANYLTTVSKKDAKEFVSRYGVSMDRIRAIPTGTTEVDKAKLIPPERIRNRYELDAEIVAVFHGDCSHPPNREAAEYITATLAPSLDQADADVQFLLVGSGMPQVETSTVRTAGYVEDLFSVLNVADIAIVPIRHGGGTKTKMYDYISLGIPIVTSKKGTEGIDLRDGIHGIITERVDEDFRNAIIELADNESTRHKIRVQLRSLSSEYNWENSADKLADFYRGIE